MTETRSWMAAVVVVAAAVFVASGATVASWALKARPVTPTQVAAAADTDVPITAKPIRVIAIAKSDRLVVPVPPVPNYGNSPPAAPVKVAAAEAEAPAPEPETKVHSYRRHRYTEAGDICARHHLHKVIVGRGWRCR